ncbi:unnamed protein product, partial [Hapterophycus canaliculatus]
RDRNLVKCIEPLGWKILVTKQFLFTSGGARHSRNVFGRNRCRSLCVAARPEAPARGGSTLGCIGGLGCFCLLLHERSTRPFLCITGPNLQMVRFVLVDSFFCVFSWYSIE